MTIAKCQWTAIGRLAAHQHPHCRRQDRFCKTFYEAAAHWVVKCMHEIEDEMIDTKRAMLNRDHLVGRLTRGSRVK